MLERKGIVMIKKTIRTLSFTLCTMIATPLHSSDSSCASSSQANHLPIPQTLLFRAKKKLGSKDVAPVLIEASNTHAEKKLSLDLDHEKQEVRISDGNNSRLLTHNSDAHRRLSSATFNKNADMALITCKQTNNRGRNGRRFFVVDTTNGRCLWRSVLIKNRTTTVQFSQDDAIVLQKPCEAQPADSGFQVVSPSAGKRTYVYGGPQAFRKLSPENRQMLAAIDQHHKVQQQPVYLHEVQEQSAPQMRAALNNMKPNLKALVVKTWKIQDAEQPCPSEQISSTINTGMNKFLKFIFVDVLGTSRSDPADTKKPE